MPRTRKDEAPVVVDFEVLTSRHAQLDGYTVVFEEYHVDGDAGSVFAALPDGRCQCPHWGQVQSGELTLRYADRSETYRAGDAYYARPGHVPAVTAGTEVIEFSPTAELEQTLAAVAAAMSGAAAAAR